MELTKTRKRYEAMCQAVRLALDESRRRLDAYGTLAGRYTVRLERCDFQVDVKWSRSTIHAFREDGLRTAFILPAKPEVFIAGPEADPVMAEVTVAAWQMLERDGWALLSDASQSVRRQSVEVQRRIGPPLPADVLDVLPETQPDPVFNLSSGDQGRSYLFMGNEVARAPASRMALLEPDGRSVVYACALAFPLDVAGQPYWAYRLERVAAA